jgi:hypothetical protein
LQQWFKTPHFPRDEIEDGWNNGYQVTSLAYGEGAWTLVLSQTDNPPAQYTHTEAEFPDEEIAKGIANGYRPTSLVFADGLWALVMSK